MVRYVCVCVCVSMSASASVSLSLCVCVCYVCSRWDNLILDMIMTYAMSCVGFAGFC